MFTIHIKGDGSGDADLDNTFRGPNGISKPVRCPLEMAWTAMVIQGNLGPATVKFQVSPVEKKPTELKSDTPFQWFDYPGPATTPAGIYDPDGLGEEGLFKFEFLLGCMFGRIKWEGADNTTDVLVSVTSQMV